VTIKHMLSSCEMMGRQMWDVVHLQMNGDCQQYIVHNVNYKHMNKHTLLLHYYRHYYTTTTTISALEVNLNVLYTEWAIKNRLLYYSV